MPGGGVQAGRNVSLILSWSMGVLLCSSAISVAARSSGHPIINRHQHDGFAIRRRLREAKPWLFRRFLCYYNMASIEKQVQIHSHTWVHQDAFVRRDFVYNWTRDTSRSRWPQVLVGLDYFWLQLQEIVGKTKPEVCPFTVVKGNMYNRE